jgi:hypothetical protein
MLLQSAEQSVKLLNDEQSLLNCGRSSRTDHAVVKPAVAAARATTAALATISSASYYCTTRSITAYAVPYT